MTPDFDRIARTIIWTANNGGIDSSALAEQLRLVWNARDPEGAVGTLQTALRQQIVEWRAKAAETRPYGNGTVTAHSERTIATLRQCADQLERLLPALEPTP